jgi:putative endonuclease
MIKQGDAFETIACDFLTTAGLALVARNWRCRLGEIDLIMREGETLVFVEVRKRNSARFGGAAASISVSKLQKLEAAVSLYLSQLPRQPACRVDAITFDGTSTATHLQWIKNILQR